MNDIKSLPLPEYRWESGAEALKPLIGTTVQQVFWSSDEITFVTDQGIATFEVEGDCCSHSYFHDLIGLDHLLAGPVTSVEDVELGEADLTCHCCEHGDCVRVYGYRIFTMHPKWGEMTCVFSFRNDSNGYYGGTMSRGEDKVHPDQERLTEDKVQS